MRLRDRLPALLSLVSVAVLGLVITPAPSTGAVAAAEDWASVQPLRDVTPWPVGIAVDQRELTGTGAAVVSRHFDQITAENAMKPAYIWRDPARTSWTQWDWSAADAYVDFARERGLRVYGHTLLWHQQMPAWFYQRVDGTPYWDAAQRRCLPVTEDDRALMRWRITTYIDGVAAHFRSRYGEFGSPGNPLVAFDVVNEAIDSTSDHFRQVENPLYCVLGTTYLEHALRAADAAFRDADGHRSLLLFINDFNTEWSWKSDDQLAVVRDLLHRGVPLDGVGHQLHLGLADRSALLQDHNLPRTLDQIAALGLRQAVTELDVGLAPGLAGAELAARLQEQGDLYAELFTLFREHDLFSVSVWGPHDGRTWRTGTHPLLFDASWGVKPAFHGASERAPRILADLPPAVDAIEGESVQLALEYDGAPVPTVTWQRRRAGEAVWTTLATGPSVGHRLDVTSEDDGAEVRAVVVNRRGNVTSTVTRLAVRPPDPVALTRVPAVVGTARLGETLRADAGSWVPTPDRLALQWLRDGMAVAGATGATYAVGPADVGRRLAVRVIAAHLDHRDATATSAPSAPVARAAAQVRTTVRHARPGVLRVQVTVGARGTTPAGAVVVRVVGGPRRAVWLTDGRASVRLRLDGGGRHRLVASYPGSRWVAPASVERVVRTRG